jgi:ORF6N domain
MAKAIKPIAVVEEGIISKIYLIRGQKVMIDRDLAELYGVDTKVLKQAVRRNINRFPSDFLFEMDTNELANWRSQIVTSKEDGKGLRYAPFCFTEQGVAMLSSVLNSERAIKVNIQIMRIYARMREMLMTNKDILLKLEQLERQVVQNSDDIQRIFMVLKQLLIPPEQANRRRIGFKRAADGGVTEETEG